MFYLGKHQGPQDLPGKSAPDWPNRFVQLAREAKHPSLKAFYEAGTVTPDTPISEVPLMAMDFETTGLDASRDDIVSIGLVSMSLQRIRLSDAHRWTLKPRSDLQDQSIVIHGITHSEVAEAPDLTRILEQLLTLMAGQVIVVHHRGIERNFLDAALRKRIGEGIEFPVIDTMELEARLHRRKRPGVLDKFLGRRPVPIRLPESRLRYHLPHYRPHDALTDALASAELLQAQVAHRFTPETPLSQLWI